MIPLAEALGHPLDCLRVLHGPVCEQCLCSYGEVEHATERVSREGYGPDEWLCPRCYYQATEGAWERYCEDFYGGSAPMTFREREEAARLDRIEELFDRD